MAKRVVCLPICTMLLALLCVSLPALADSVDLASAQPDFDRVAPMSFSGFNNNHELFSICPRETERFDGRFSSEFRPFWEFKPEGRHFTDIGLFGRHHFNDRDLRDFDRDRWDVGSDWEKRPRSVPEPSSLTLLGSGVLGAAFALKKRLRR